MDAKDTLEHRYMDKTTLKKGSTDTATITGEVGSSSSIVPTTSADSTLMAQEFSKALKSLASVIKNMESAEKNCRSLVLSMKMGDKAKEAKELASYLAVFSDGLDEAKMSHQRLGQAAGNSVEAVQEVRSAQEAASTHLLGLKNKMDAHSETSKA